MTVREIKDYLLGAVKGNVPEELPPDLLLEIEIPPEPKMGDLTLACFTLAKYLKNKPGKIAADLATKILPDEIIEKAINEGPYLNFWLKKEFWFQTICQEILELKEKFGTSDFGKNKKILVEYSAPNTNKPQHLGHLRNNFLGMATAKLFTKLGFDVIRANLINDRGIHICKSMLIYQKWGAGKTPESEKMKGDHFVGKYYVMFEEKSKEDPKLLDEAQELLRKWEAGDADTLALWHKMNDWAMDGFKETYEKVGAEFDKWYYESETYQLGREIILKALKKKLCYQREDGAIEIDLGPYNLDKKVLIRADGTSVYVTQDIGLAQLKQKDFKPDRSIYVVGSEQDYYFRLLFTILAIFGFKWAKNLYHLSYAWVFLPEGRMKSREGIVVDADDLIAEMEQLAKSEIISRDANLSLVDVSSRAEKIAMAAIKFFFLKYTPKQEVQFNPEASISFEGATGPYIQYTYARIQSIIRKFVAKNTIATEAGEGGENAGAETTAPADLPELEIDYSVLGNENEIGILKLLFIYPDTIQRSALEMNPAHLADYLLKLCQKFNEFYHQHQVVGEEEKLSAARLYLIKSVAEVIKNGLEILGVEVLEKM